MVSLGAGLTDLLAMRPFCWRCADVKIESDTATSSFDALSLNCRAASECAVFDSLFPAIGKHASTLAWMKVATSCQTPSIAPEPA